MKKLIKSFSIICFFFFITNSSSQAISINTSKDTLYVYDEFNVPDRPLTNNNGNTGSGWSSNWTYTNNVSDGVTVQDGYFSNISSGFGISRDLINPIQFSGSTFYVSFLFKKNSSGNFKITGNRKIDDLDRFGIHIDSEGKLGAQAGVVSLVKELD